MDKNKESWWREEIRKVLSGESVYLVGTDKTKGMTKQEIIEWIIETYVKEEKEESYGRLVDYMNLVEEAKELREQYLEVEERIKELGKSTKRVQTLVSKLSGKEDGKKKGAK